jgi:hypothetical protein
MARQDLMSKLWYWSWMASKRSARTRDPFSCTNSTSLPAWIGGTWLQPCAVCGRVKHAAGVSALELGPGQQRHSAPEVITSIEAPTGTRWRISLTCRPVRRG